MNNPPDWKSRLIFSCLLLVGLSANAQLLHRYDFETTGGANDTVGTANGTIYGSATVGGGALNTIGTAGGLSGGVPQNSVGLPASAVAGITNAFSLEAWFACSYNGGYCTLFSFSDGTTSNYVLATPARGTSPYQSDVAVKGGGGNASEQLANQIYCDTGLMHDMIVTYDGTNVACYLDGTLATYSGLQNSFTDSGLNLSTLTRIGVAGGSPFADNTINGKVYDFRVYGQALTLNQVAGIYALGTNASNASISNTLATTPVFGIPFNGNLVRMPFYGDVGLHDPGTMRKDGNSYFIYGDGTGIPGITSTDLRNWSSAAPVFTNNPPAWTTNAVPGGSPDYFWAPDLAWFNGLWHLYYAYSQWGTINSVIGVATSPSLTNAVWTDQGKVVESNYPATTNTDTTAYNCIDPSIYVAPNGTVWMSFGSYSTGILVTQIDPTTGLRLTTSSLVATQVANNAGGGWGSTEEGSCIYQHGGYWYLFANWGGCCDLTYSTYNIRVGRSTSPTGPYFDKNGASLTNSGGTMFLESTARYIGPGHAAICDDNGTNWFTYHFYDGLANGYPTVGMNQLYWSADGWPVMTNEWSAFYPLSADANESTGTYDGTLEGGARFTNDASRGSVLSLDGSSGYVSLPLSVGNASTFAAWVKWNGGASWQRIFDFGNDTTNYLFLTPAANTGVMRFAITTSGPGGEQQINAPYALPANSWVHVAVTLDGSTGTLYLDGTPIATNNSLTIRPWQTTPHNNNLGKSQFSADPFFNGRMASFRIFGRALTAAEIQNLAWAHPALVHRYSFSTNYLTAGWDSIGMAHGLLMGNATVGGDGLELTGASGGYLNLPGGLVSGSAAATIEFWATFGTNGDWAQVFDFGNMSGPNGQNFLFFAPHAPTNTQTLALTSATSANLTLAGTLDNRTLHVACIVDPAGDYGAIYTNGVLESSGTVAWPALSTVGTEWSFLGRSLFTGEPYLNASIDELRIYDGRLTPQQIAADYQFGPDALALPVSLTQSYTASSVHLSWPSFAGFALETTPAPNTIWTVAGAPALSNDSWQITIPASNAAQFFRLRR
jgi:Glycosyl hydrolases family 43/Concanavalin A-like lectin/glucanases superfamily